MVDYSQMSDEELYKISGLKPPSFSQNVVSDVISIGKGLPESIGQGMATAGKVGLDILTGSSIRDMLSGIPEKNPISPTVKSMLTAPSIRELLATTQQQSIAEQPKYKDIPTALKTMYKNPLTNIPAQAAMIVLPSLIKGGGRPIGAYESADILKTPIRGTGKRPPTYQEPGKAYIDTAEVLPTTLEKTNIQNLTNKYVQDNLRNFAGGEAAEFGKTARDATMEIKDKMKQSFTDFYKNEGIKWDDALPAPETINKLETLLDEASDTMDLSALRKAKNIVNRLKGTTEGIVKEPVIEKKTMGNIPEGVQDVVVGQKETVVKKPLTFGNVADASEKLYGLGEDNISVSGKKTSTGRFFTDLGNILTEAKRSDPRIARAGKKFSDLLKAKVLLNKSLRLQSSMGEMRLEGKLNSSFRDKGNLTLKENLNNIDDVLAKYPETKEMVGYGGFTDKIKLAQIANDIAAKKATTPSGLSRFGLQAVGNFFRVGDPEAHALFIIKGLKEGWIKSEALKEGVTENKPGIVFGRMKTRVGALRDILQKPKKEGK